MPSQRLLKMLDPVGHVVGPRSILSSTAPKAVVWAPDPDVAAWIGGELAAARVEALRARSFRHLDTSLRPGAKPNIALAVIDVSALGEAAIDALVAARWAGYTGAMIAIAPAAAISPRTKMLIRVDSVVPPRGPLRDAVAHLAIV